MWRKILLKIIMQSGFERGVNGINRAGPRKAESAPDTLFGLECMGYRRTYGGRGRPGAFIGMCSSDLWDVPLNDDDDDS